MAKVDRKRNYTDEDIETYLDYINKLYDNDNTYQQECIRLRQFLRRLPGADKGRQLTRDIPKAPKHKKYTHAFTLDDIEELC